jgi:hypothetical protein
MMTTRRDVRGSRLLQSRPVHAAIFGAIMQFGLGTVKSGSPPGLRPPISLRDVINCLLSASIRVHLRLSFVVLHKLLR